MGRPRRESRAPGTSRNRNKDQQWLALASRAKAFYQGMLPIVRMNTRCTVSSRSTRSLLLCSLSLSLSLVLCIWVSVGWQQMAFLTVTSKV